MDTSKILIASKQLFARINTVRAEKGHEEKLDSNEIAQAKAFGFDNLFKLTENMTEAEFFSKYYRASSGNEQEQKAFEQQERNIHVKYIQLKYGVKTEIQVGESIEQFEARAKYEGLNNAIDAKIKEFGLGEIGKTNEASAMMEGEPKNEEELDRYTLNSYLNDYKKTQEAKAQGKDISNMNYATLEALKEQALYMYEMDEIKNLCPELYELVKEQ